MEKVILGIDPGTNYMGYGLLNCTGKSSSLIDMGVLNLTRVKDPIEKLTLIFNTTAELIRKHNASVVSIEDPFFGKNVQSMLKLGRAQGMAIAAAIYLQVPVYQYAPRRIKQSITGKGSASKEQVAAMLQRLLGLTETVRQLDATDGLAVAMCHFFQGDKPAINGEYNSWKSFLSKNPGRVK